MKMCTTVFTGPLANAKSVNSCRIFFARTYQARRWMAAIATWRPTQTVKMKLANGLLRLQTMAKMQRGEVWWVEFDPSTGSEIRKTRPAVIVSNDAANRNLPRVMAMPMTSNVAKVYPGEALVSVNGQASKVMADQIMAADKRRLKSRFGRLDRTDMGAVEDAIRLHFGLSR